MIDNIFTELAFKIVFLYIKVFKTDKTGVYRCPKCKRVLIDRGKDYGSNVRFLVCIRCGLGYSVDTITGKDNRGVSY